MILIVKCLFFISVDRYDIHKGWIRFIFHFNYVFKFKFYRKYALAVKILQTKESWNYYHPEVFLFTNSQYLPSNYCDCGSPL
jgi:hypothetical protein